MEDIELATEFERRLRAGTIRGSINDTDTVSELLTSKVQEMIASVPDKWPHSPLRPTKPLLRLRVCNSTTIHSIPLNVR
jgi:hypothetical protein